MVLRDSLDERAGRGGEDAVREDALWGEPRCGMRRAGERAAPDARRGARQVGGGREVRRERDPSAQTNHQQCGAAEQ